MFYAFLIPLLPTLFWVSYFYRRDTIEKEPRKLILYSVLLGALSTFFVAVAESFVLIQTGLRIFLTTPGTQGLLAMLAVGFVEETAKFLTLRFSFFRSKYFNEVSDGIIYAVGIGLGFAFVENIFYSLSLGFEISFYRALSTPIFHASAAAIAGYFLALSTFEKRRHWGYFGLLLAVTIHGTSNYLLIAASLLQSTLYLILVAVLDLALIFWVLALYRRAVREGPLPRKQVRTHPALAFFLNIVPGFGLIYLGRWLAGIFVIALTIFIVSGASLAAAFVDISLWPLLSVVASGLLLLVALFSGTISFFSARRSHSHPDNQFSKRR